MRLEHVAIAVKDIEQALGLYRDCLGMRLVGIEEIPDQGVKVAFLECGDGVAPAAGGRIELLQPLSETSPVGKFINKKGEGLHHVALAVPDIRQALADMKQAGVELIDAEPRPGAHGSLIAFVHPRAANAVLIELCQPASKLHK